MLPCPGLPPAGPPGLGSCGSKRSGQGAAAGNQESSGSFLSSRTMDRLSYPFVGFPSGWTPYLGISRWSSVIIELNGRMVGEVGGLFPWDLPLSKSINRF